MTVIYHNPRCSKSRETLALLQQKGIEPNIIRYLETPPDLETLRDITTKLDCSAAEIIRTNEQGYKSLALEEIPDHEASLKLLVEHPALLQRPIVIHNDKAAVGRPPENVLSIL